FPRLKKRRSGQLRCRPEFAAAVLAPGCVAPSLNPKPPRRARVGAPLRKEDKMHKRTLLVVAPLCVVALAAGVAFAAPMAAEPENPHAVRPIAASPQDRTAS